MLLDLQSLWQQGPNLPKPVWQQLVPVLVEDPDNRGWRSSPDYAGLLFNRTYPAGLPWYLWTPSHPQSLGQFYEEELFKRAPDYAGLFFNRGTAQLNSQPFFMWRQGGIAWLFFEPEFLLNPSATIFYNHVAGAPPPPPTAEICHPLGFSMIRLGGGGFN